MQNSAITINSVKTTERIKALDVMRGIVLLGILLMNINGFGLTNAYDNPTVAGGAEGLNLYTWMTTTLLFEGTMRGLFSLLFGVGMFILLKRSEDRGAGVTGPDIYFRRLLWLLFFGLVHGYLLLWKGEILYDYALMGLLVYSFRNMAPRKLMLIAAFLVSIGTFWNYVDHRSNIKLVEIVTGAEAQKAAGLALTPEQQEATSKWQEIEKKKSPAFVNDNNEKMRSGYFTVVKHLAPINMATDTTWFYKYNLWDILSMMLLGIALFKLNILSAKRSYRLYGLMVAAGYIAGLSINYYEMQTIMNGNFSFLAFSKAEVTYYLGRLAVSIGHIGAIMILVKAAGIDVVEKKISCGRSNGAYQLHYAFHHLHDRIYRCWFWIVWKIATLRITIRRVLYLDLSIDRIADLVKVF